MSCGCGKPATGQTSYLMMGGKARKNAKNKKTKKTKKSRRNKSSRKGKGKGKRKNKRVSRRVKMKGGGILPDSITNEFSFTAKAFGAPFTNAELYKQPASSVQNYKV